MTLKTKVQIYVDPMDWEYLAKFAAAAGANRSAIVRDMVSQFAGQMRRAFGEDFSAEKLDMNNFYKVMLLETSQALSQVASMPEPSMKK